MHYYDRERPAFGHWYEWIIVLFLTMFTWIMGQFILTAPFGSILASVDPEAAAQVDEEMASAGATMLENPGLIIALSLGMLVAALGSVGAIIALLIHYLGARGKGSVITGTVFASIAIIGAFTFIWASGKMGGTDTLMTVIGKSPLAYTLMLLTFPAALGGLYLGWTKVQERTLTSLHTAFTRFRWGRVAQSFAIGWIVLGGSTYLATLLGWADPAFVFDATRFVPFAIISILLLPVQSATEEIVVRGFMNKGLIRFLGNKWVAFTLTSGLFMALHLANPEAVKAAEDGILPLVMSGYFFFGFAACLMVLIDDGLESAIGVHAANNTFAAIFVNYENSVLPTPSVWQVTPDPASDSWATILVLGVILLALWVTRKPWLRGTRAPLPVRESSAAIFA